MSHKIRIRLASERDLSALTSLEELAFDSDRFTRDQIDYLLTRSRATTFILERGPALAGSACVLWRKSRFWPARLQDLLLICLETRFLCCRRAAKSPEIRVVSAILLAMP